MKSFFKYLLMAAIFIGPLTIVSCSEKGGDEPETPELPGGMGSMEFGWTDKGDTVEFTISQSYGAGYEYTATYVCKFDKNGLCYDALAHYKFQSREIANAFYAQSAQLYEGVTQNGNTVTIDETNTFVGMTKDQVYQIYESLQSYNSMN